MRVRNAPLDHLSARHWQLHLFECAHISLIVHSQPPADSVDAERDAKICLLSFFVFLSFSYPFAILFSYFFFLDPSLLRSNPLYIRLLSVFYPFVIPSFLTQASFSNHSMPRKLRDRSNIINSVKWRRKMQRETPMIHCLPCLGLGLWLTLTVYFELAYLGWGGGENFTFRSIIFPYQGILSK